MTKVNKVADNKSAQGGPFAGVWRSSYTYIHFYNKQETQSEHFVRIYQAGNHLIAESIPGANRSYLLVRLTVDGDVATGTWTEQTDPDGDFKGTTYNGALQLLIADDKRSMEGRWVALNKTGKVQTNTWKLTYFGEGLPGEAERL